MAWARGRARRAGAAARDRHPHPARQDKERRPARPVQRDLRLPGGERGPGRRQACGALGQPPRPGRRGVRLPCRVGGPHPPVGAAGVRPLHPGADRRSGDAGHPVDTVERPVAGPARARQVPEARAGHDDLDDRSAGRGHRRRQEAHYAAPGCGRPPRPSVRDSSFRRRSRRRRPQDRVPGRDQAHRRESRAGGHARPRGRGLGARRLPHVAGGGSPCCGRGRELRHRQRLPRASRRRAHGGGGAAGPGPRDRRREAHRSKACGSYQRRPSPRHRPREGLDEDQDRRYRHGTGPEAGVRIGGGAAQGRLRQAGRHGQHVDGRHLHRPDMGRARGEHRDRGGGGQRHRPGCGRHRLPDSRHLQARAGDGRGDRRGQRRPRIPNAHAPHGGRSSVRGHAGSGHALPARDAVPHPDHLRHRLEREDDHRADDRPHPEGYGAQGRDDLDRRHLHRRAAGEAGRRKRSQVGSDGPAEPPRRPRRVRGGAGRDPPRGAGLRP